MKWYPLLGTIIVALFASSCTSTQETTTPDPHGYISVSTANRMIGSYLQSIDSLQEVPDLHSLILDASLLRHYLNGNASVQKVKVMLAHTLSYIDEGHQGQPAGYRSGALTIVLAGYDSSGNYVYHTPGHEVLNASIPCPRNCPLEGTASEDLLP